MKLTEAQVKVLLALAWWKADGLGYTFVGPGTVGERVWGYRKKRGPSHYARTGGKVLKVLAGLGLAEYRSETFTRDGRYDYWGWALTSKGRAKVERLKEEGADLDSMIDASGE